MAIRVPLQADRAVVDALRDTDNELDRLRATIADLTQRLAALEAPVKAQAAGALTLLGDTQISGQLYVFGPVNFLGSFTAPNQNLGLADMEPLLSGDALGKTRVFAVHGSIACTSAINCETLTVRNLIVTGTHTGP